MDVDPSLITGSTVHEHMYEREQSSLHETHGFEHGRCRWCGALSKWPLARDKCPRPFKFKPRP